MLGFSVAYGEGDGSFEAPVDHVTGAVAELVAVGDVDGDGLLDVVTLDGGTRTVHTTLATGVRTFGPAIAAALVGGPATPPTGIALVDFGNDGGADLFVRIQNSLAGAKAAALASVGDGTFTQVGAGLGGTTDSGQVVDAAFADLDLDGRIDGVLCRNGQDTLSILVNATPAPGSAFVVPKSTEIALASTQGAIGVAISDLNGDGLPDIVCSNATTDDVRVCIGLGGGAFAAPVAFTGVDDPLRPELGDVNGDGNFDIVLVDGSDDSIAVLLGNGAGSFGAPVVRPILEPVRTFRVADLDADGRSDLVSTRFNGREHVTVQFGRADGTFSTGTNLDVGAPTSSVAMGDVDRDGVMDLLVACPNADQVRVRTGLGDGSFGAAVLLAVGDRPESLALGDLNGDGAVDLVTANAGANGLTARFGQGNGNFPARRDLSVGTEPVDVAVGDLDGDGRDDVVAAVRGSDELALAFGTPALILASAPAVAVGTAPVAVVVGDLNGDGALDLVSANQGSGDLSVVLGVGDGTFATPASIPLTFAPRDVVLADLDDDGALDLVAVGDGATPSGRAVVLLGQGDGTFPAQLNSPIGSAAATVASHDVDGDAIMDLIVVDDVHEVARFLRGTGTAGGFVGPFAFGVPVGCGSIALADLDGDGMPDLAATSAAGGLIRLAPNRLFD